MTLPLIHETIWFDKHRYDEAEKLFEEQAAKERRGTSAPVLQEKPKSNTSLAEQIANARQRIIKTLQAGDNIADLEHIVEAKDCEALNESIQRLIENNKNMWKFIENVGAEVKMLSKKLESLEKKITDEDKIVSRPVEDEKTVLNTSVNNHAEEENDDDVDLFGSDEEDEAAIKLREERLKAYETKKSKKTAVIAKSSVVFDVKPWDDETDLKEMEIRVRGINSDGLKWGASKLVPLAYGIKKLQIVCIVEDDKISIDWLQETIQEDIEDLVQSVDIVAFNKL